MLDAGIEIFRVLAEDDQVDRQIGEAGLQARQHFHRTEINVQIEFLAQSHVDAGMAARDRALRWVLSSPTRVRASD